MVPTRSLLGVFLGIWTLTVSSYTFDPLGVHDLVPGQVITLNWKPANGGTISLFLIEEDNRNESVISTVHNIGAYTWTVPGNLVLNTKYAIAIADEDGGSNSEANTDSFSINDPSHSTSASGSSASESTIMPTSTSSATATTDGPLESTIIPTSTSLPPTMTGITLSTSAPTTFATAVSVAGNMPPTTAIATDMSSSTSLSSLTPPPDEAGTGLSSSGRIGLIVCLSLGVPLICIGLLFRYYMCRYPRKADTDQRDAPTFFQWLIRRNHWSSRPESPIDKASEKRITGVDSEYTINSPTISQGLRSSPDTQDSGMWHYKPELPGSDPLRESSAQFLMPVELPAWGPDELHPSGRTEPEQKTEVHEKGDEETTTLSNTKAEQT